MAALSSDSSLRAKKCHAPVGCYLKCVRASEDWWSVPIPLSRTGEGRIFLIAVTKKEHPCFFYYNTTRFLWVIERRSGSWRNQGFHPSRMETSQRVERARQCLPLRVGDYAHEPGMGGAVVRLLAFRWWWAESEWEGKGRAQPEDSVKGGSLLAFRSWRGRVSCSGPTRRRKKDSPHRNTAHLHVA